VIVYGGSVNEVMHGWLVHRPIELELIQTVHLNAHITSIVSDENDIEDHERD